jgi:sensitive to high expression protein 9
MLRCNESTEQRINDTRVAARQAKVHYEEAVLQRATSQREVNDLLQRKSTWTDSDVSRFTTLVRQDHLYEQHEQAAKARVDESEDAVEREFSQLMRLILARYHEEQVWSDKIRSASTYGQMAALGLNLLVFLLAIVLVEPWKRKRLAQTFERKVEELSEDYAKMMEVQMRNVEEKLRGHEALLVKMAEDLAAKQEDSAPLQLPPTPAAVEGTGLEDVKIKVKEKEKEKTVHLRIPGVIDVPVSGRTLELAAVGTGTFIIGVVGSILMSR